MNRFYHFQDDYMMQSQHGPEYYILQVQEAIANELHRLVEIQKVRAKIESGAMKISPNTIEALKGMIEEV